MHQSPRAQLLGGGARPGLAGRPDLYLDGTGLALSRPRQPLAAALRDGSSALPRIVLDLYTRRVVGWAMADHLRHELALAALDMAIVRQQPAPGLVHHADRGVQYAAHRYRARLRRHGMLCSMSRKGDCWDNAPMESFFATLKGELVEAADYQTRDEARADLFQYIEGFYNRRRLHSGLGYLTPEQKAAAFQSAASAA